MPIEYANGPVESKWGALRAQAGHPAPFNLKMMEIGNENGFQAYSERWPLFVKAIKARYPEIKLVANQWGESYPRDPMPEIVDEHYYHSPEWFMRKAHQYDGYDRNGPKIYVGEYAVTKGAGNGNLRGAVGEAAFMTGLERNSDVVLMASYAPLFCNANHKRWPVNLINYDSQRLFGIPSYYVQQMFAHNRGDVVLPTTLEASVIAPSPLGGPISVGTHFTQAEFKEIIITRNGERLAAPTLKDTVEWKLLGKGIWKAQNGILSQTGTGWSIKAVFGDPNWTDYTLSLKARKIGGDRGFLIGVGPDAYAQWNLGDRDNNQYKLECDGLEAPVVPGKIETGRWYDIRVEVKGIQIKYYLDGNLIHDAKLADMKSLYASASRDEQTGDIILKVVNVAASAQEVDINLVGLAKISGPAKGIVLASGSPTDENTLEEPTKVVPKEITIPNIAPKFRHSFPANSVTVLRVR